MFQLHQLALQLFQPLGQRAVLAHPLADFFNALKIHHFQRRQCSVRVPRGKEPQLVAFFCRLILGEAAER